MSLAGGELDGGSSGAHIYSVTSGYEGDLGLAPTLNPLDASVDGQGGTIRGKPVFTVDQAAFQLNRGDGLVTYDGVTYETGAQWYGAKGGHNQGYYDNAVSKVDHDGSLDTLSFGFYDDISQLPEAYVYTKDDGTKAYYLPQGQGFSAFDADQRAAAREAIQTWDDLIAVKFVETSVDKADIKYFNTTTGPAQAAAYLPYGYGQGYVPGKSAPVDFNAIAGDVFVNPNQISNHQFNPGEYGLTTLIHETGHTLGLQHPGDYNFGPGFAANYVNGAPYYQDSNQYSIMSYWGPYETGAANVDWSTFQFVYQSTPGVHDVAAIQRIYGADPTTRTGDTTYGFNNNSGRDQFDLVKNPLAEFTIYDAGGNDTLDLSGFSTPETIDLNPGQFSSAGGSGVVPLDTLKAEGILPASYTQAQYDALRAKYNSPDGLLHDNISIAYGTIIENAVGGSGDDLIIGNSAANVLNGGAGFDTVSYQDATAGVTASLFTMSGTGGDAAGDKYLNVEALTGSNYADHLEAGNNGATLSGLGGDDYLKGGNGQDKLYGGDGNDTLLGGNGNDVLSGGAGDDRLDGGNGNDALTGGTGNDTLLGGDGNDKLEGGDGDNIINGGAGDDTIIVGGGNNQMVGGAGADTFYFTAASGVQQIGDFQTGVDKIDLHLIDANTNLDGMQAFTFSNASSFSHVAGELIEHKVAGGYELLGDVNGDGVADLVIQSKYYIAPNDLILH